ncbi:MAG: alpha/beta hydrolase [Candidatus Saccharibacteria bacterium]|nr:alpha/beta hydrolase [Candidatus Saccharibacteria bacterium]
MKTLYVIHGWTYTVEPWAKTIAILKKDYGIKVEMLNVPGLTAKSNKVWTTEEYAAWAAKNIPTGAIALGHSNGGRILLNMNVEKPNKLKHLILLSSAGVYEETKKKTAVRKASKMFAPLKKSALLRKVFHKVVGASDYEHAPDNMKQTLTNMLESDKNLDVTKVTVPTTILWGEADTVTPLRMGIELSQKIPNATIKTYKKWNHAPYISEPAALASAIAAAMKDAEKVEDPREIKTTPIEELPEEAKLAVKEELKEIKQAEKEEEKAIKEAVKIAEKENREEEKNAEEKKEPEEPTVKPSEFIESGDKI